ncbi:MAG TPA: hypothetical protein VKB40_00655 [Candidatus Acidoferrales bacterium]|nr:hypothetical protein [Candidatus Acidoferrales bacterium]
MSNLKVRYENRQTNTKDAQLEFHDVRPSYCPTSPARSELQQHDAAKDRRDQTQQRANQKIFREALRLSRNRVINFWGRWRVSGRVRKLIA